MMSDMIDDGEFYEPHTEPRCDCATCAAMTADYAAIVQQQGTAPFPREIVETLNRRRVDSAHRMDILASHVLDVRPSTGGVVVYEVVQGIFA